MVKKLMAAMFVMIMSASSVAMAAPPKVDLEHVCTQNKNFERFVIKNNTGKYKEVAFITSETYKVVPLYPRQVVEVTGKGDEARIVGSKGKVLDREVARYNPCNR